MTLHVALICPQIPPNTGNIARLCVGADVPLHLIEPLGFSLDERSVRRAGIDHWDKVDLWVHPNWFRFRDAISRDRCLYFSANAQRDYREAPYAANSVLVFGNETEGLPARMLEKHPERCFRIPMPGDVRSLNLSNAVSVVLYEGLRQLGLPTPELPAPVEVDLESVDSGASASDESEDDGQLAMLGAGTGIPTDPGMPRGRPRGSRGGRGGRGGRSRRGGPPRPRA
jgi:tRNA (cytidine/uridine-2'-O-)-methyltransferase